MGIRLLSASQMNETWKLLKVGVIFISFPNSREALEDCKLFMCVYRTVDLLQPSPAAPALQQFGTVFV